jgi:plasmid stability protein
MQSLLRPVRLLIGRNIDLGLGPLAGRNLALEQNVDLAVRAALHLRQVEVCQGEAEETSTGPNVTALATKVGRLLGVSSRNQNKRYLW